MVSFSKESNPTAPVISTTRSTQVLGEELSKPVSDLTPTLGVRTRLAWGAVIAGALTALALLVLSSSLGYACAIPAYRGGNYGFGALVWSVVSAAFAFFFGGMVVEYLTRRGETRLGILHGVLAWVLAVNLTTLVSVSVPGLFRGFLPLDVARVAGPIATTDAGSINAAAWGIFLSLLAGLISAAIGGIAGYFFFEKQSARV
jgi:hypothetical protein